MTTVQNPSVFFFGYSWSHDRALDAYQSNIVDELLNQGFDVTAYCSNLFALHDGIYGVVDSFNDSLIEKLSEKRPAMIISMNQGLLSEELCKKAAEICPIYAWIVDHPSHLAYTNSLASDLNSVPKTVKIITASSEIYEIYKNNCKWLDTNSLFFLPSLTNPSIFTTKPKDKARNIVFVGSTVVSERTVRLFAKAAKDGKNWRVLCDIINKVEQTSTIEFLDFRNQEISQLLKAMELGPTKFKIMISDFVSTSLRIKCFEKIQNLGLEFFGNADWPSTLRGHPSLLKHFNPRKISTHEDLAEIYQGSKLAIQIPQLQVGKATSYRVFDIMASDALLIHPHTEDSDLYKIFGKDCPVPTFKNLDELHSICSYYLENENERQKLVKKCNDLISENFTFHNRIKKLVEWSNGPFSSSQRGTLVYFKSRTKLGLKGSVEFFLSNLKRRPVEFLKDIARTLLRRKK